MSTYYQPSEWAQHSAVWIGFPSAADLWLNDLEGAQAEVAAFALAVLAQGKGERVDLVCANAAAADTAQTLTGGCATIIEAPFFDVWLRDTGPIMVRKGDGLVALDYRGNGWGGKYPSPLDDDLARLLCTAAGLPREPRDWVLEGGAIDVDGAGLLVTTEQCLLNPNRNPGLNREDIEARLCAHLGVERVLWLRQGLVNDHTDGHVDNLARFVAPGVIAIPVATWPNDPNAEIYEDARQIAKAAGLEVVDIVSPGRVEVDGAIVPASYMNFYIGNAAVVVPMYGVSDNRDSEALGIISSLFPSHETIGLPANHILTGGGSFHCISQQVPLLR
jgi:agmatine deiminase